MDFRAAAHAMNYLILDREADFALLTARVPDPDAVLVPLAAAAYCGIPASWPAARILPLSRLVSPEELAAEVTTRREWLRALYDGHDSCPYYKTHQIIDVFLEKQCLVDRLGRLEGIKHFVDQKGAWLSADGDNDERLRVAAVYMRGAPGFSATAVESMPRRRAALRLFARQLRAAWKARRSPAAGRFATGILGYGANKHFAGGEGCAVTPGVLVLQCLRRGPVGWRDAWRLLRHDRPVPLPLRARSTSVPFLEALDETQARSAAVHEIARRCAARWRPLDFYFTVNYGPIAEIAIARAMRAAGVPVVTLQHALMGHDRWTASQYLDTWASDAKIVSTETVAASMRTFEEPNDCAYLPATLPMLRRPLAPVRWSGKRVLYVVTGFTRANTMYDNRRINDSLYFERVAAKLAHLARHYEVLLRPHPYDSRQYGGRIAATLAAQTGATICTDSLDSIDAAILVDSPSTILADAMFAGRPIFVINETAALQPRFVELARAARSLFDDAEMLCDYLRATPAETVCRDQDGYARDFAALYFGADTRPLLETVDAWRVARGPAAARAVK